MAIQTTLEGLKIKGEGLSLALVTTNSTYPTASLRFTKTFPDNMTAVAIKDAVLALVDLYWQLYALMK